MNINIIPAVVEMAERIDAIISRELAPRFAEIQKGTVASLWA